MKILTRGWFMPASLLFVMAGGTEAQVLTGAIYGRVTDERGEPLVVVNIRVEGTTLGTSTDERGRFEIARIPPGRYNLMFSMVGFKQQTLTNVIVTAGGRTELSVTLEETVIPLEEVRVYGRQLRQSQDDPRSSLHRLEPRLAKDLPGFGEDVFRSLQALPGILAPSDFSAQLVVRGSGPDQNLIVMDDIEIFNPYRLYGVISMFNPATVSDISLITGGFPARYGDRLSAVLDVTNKEGSRREAAQGMVNASISNANIVLEGRAPFGVNGSYLFSARRTYYDLVLGPFARSAGLVANDVAFPNFSDLQTKVVFGPFSGHKILLNGLRSRDGVDIVSGPERQTPDSVSAYNETNHTVLGLAWHYVPSDRFFTKSVVSYYRNDGDSDFGGEFLDPSLNRDAYRGGQWDTTGIRLFSISSEQRYVFEKYSARQEITWISGRHTVEAGMGFDALRTTLAWRLELDPTLKAFIIGRGGTIQEELDQLRQYNRYNAFVQDRIKVGQRLVVQPGLRIDYYELLQKAVLAPRINVAYAADDITTLRGAFGVFYQSPGYEKLVDQNYFVDLDERYARRLLPERSIHGVFGVDRWLSGDLQLKADLYYKSFDRLVAPDVRRGTRYTTSLLPGADPRRRESWATPLLVESDSTTTIPVNGSWGHAYGVELFVEKKRTLRETRFHGWMSYALAWAERNVRGIWRPFNFDQRHTINLVGNYRATDWLDIGFHWRYGSNFPYTPPVGIQPRIVTVTQDGEERGVIQTDFRGNVVFDIDRGGQENRNSARKPAYHRLDIRATAYTNFWGLDWSFYLDVINIYNRANVLNYGYYIKDDLTLGVRRTTMFPIIPTLGFSVQL